MTLGRSDQLDGLDRAEGHGDFGVVAAGLPQVHFVGGDVGVHAHGNAHYLGSIRGRDPHRLLVSTGVAEELYDVFVGHGIP